MSKHLFIAPLFKGSWGNLKSLAKRLTSTELTAVVLSSLTVTALVLGIRQLGLQPLELLAYDQIVRLRPDSGPDSRLLVVGITETDIAALKKWPISDKIIAQALAELQQYQPQVIGIDLVRDIPFQPGHQELVAQLKKPNIIAINTLGNNEDESVSAPPSVPKERVGFSDVVTDPDGIIRRNSMIAGNKKNTFHSFSLRLAIAYLASYNIKPQITKTKDYQIGKTVFFKLKANSGGYEKIDARGYQILLNYRRYVARQVTLTQLLKKKIDPSLVKGKIVIIGATAPSVKDLFLTPYSPAEQGNPQMPGVLLHGQMVSQILSAVLDKKPLFWYWDEWLEILWIAGWSILGGIIAWRIHNPVKITLFATVCLGVLFGSGFFIFTQSGWIPLAAPALALIGTGGCVVIYQTQQAKQQQQMVMKLLGQRTSPEIADALWNERTSLLKDGIFPGQTLTATILFSDIKGFSTISEKRPPSELMSWLNEYLKAMSFEILAHQGIINSFIGDGIMAVFGVPIKRTTEAEIAADALRAVNCALAMSERLKELNHDWQNRGLPVIKIRIGIFTGPVMVGSLGGKEHLEYGVIGDSTNIAARLESCEKHRHEDNCRVLIAKETQVHLQGQFEVECWGSIELKGKQQAVEVYRVIGRAI